MIARLKYARTNRLAIMMLFWLHRRDEWHSFRATHGLPWNDYPEPKPVL